MNPLVLQQMMMAQMMGARFPQQQVQPQTQVQAAQQRIAQRQAQLPQGAAAGQIAGCAGGYGFPYCPWMPSYPPAVPTLGQCGPLIPQYLLPLGFQVQMAAGGAPTTFEVCCNGAYFYGCGFRVFNDPFQVLLGPVFAGSTDINRVCEQVDAAFWQTDDCFCPWDLGCISCLAPLVITAAAFGAPSVPPTLNAVVVGTKLTGFNMCSPFDAIALCGPGGVPGFQPTPYTPPGQFTPPPVAGGGMLGAPMGMPGTGAAG